MYETASRIALRFKWNTGLITVEDLWNLSLTQLDTIHKELIVEARIDSGESYLKANDNANSTVPLRLDIVRDIMDTMLAEEEERKSDAQAKVFTQKILGIVEAKENTELEGLSKEELLALLK